MKRVFLLLCFFAAFSLAAQNGAAQLRQTVQQQGIAQELENAPDGVTIRLLPDGGFQIFAVGTGTYDFDDVDDINDARNEATVKAKANLAKFMNESIQSDQQLEQMSEKVKKISSENGKKSSSVDKVSAKKTLSTIKNSSAALLKGVITLSAVKIPAGGTSGTYRVMVGVSSKTIEAVSRLNTAIDAPASATPAAAPAAAPAASSGLPEGWIECIGQGGDRRAAVSAALTEGIQQVYGVALQNNTKMQERVKKLKVNTKALRVSAKETASDTLTQTAGFVKEYRIISVKNLSDGRLEAVVHALIINPRAGGAKAVMIAPTQMSMADASNVYLLGPKRRVPGRDVASLVCKAFGRAFANANKFLVLQEEDLVAAIGQQILAGKMVDSGLAPSSELMKAGQMLTADYVLTSSVESLKYSRVLTMNKKTRKFGPVHKMSIRLTFKLTDVVSGRSISSHDINANLTNEEIVALLEEDEEADLVLALMGKVTQMINQHIGVN